MQRILVAGETIVDFLPETVGPLDEVETFSRRAGGAPANVAVALARLDETPSFWTRVGADPFGDVLVARLREEGLTGPLVEQDTEAKTGLAFVSLDETAERGFSFYHEGAAETRFGPGTVTDDDLAAVEWVHVDALSMDAQPSRDAVLDLAKRARDAGCTVSFDPNARPERWTEFDFADSVREGFGLADVVKATPEDLTEAGIGDLSGGADGLAEADLGPEGELDRETASSLARRITEYGPHTALITLGGAGAVASATPDAPWVGGDDPVVVSHPGYDVDPVDTTGAGDAFTAGVIASLVDGADLDATLAFANAVAAEATTAAGAMTALPDREAVAAFRDERA
jgi:fructokinase